MDFSISFEFHLDIFSFYLGCFNYKKNAVILLMQTLLFLSFQTLYFSNKIQRGREAQVKLDLLWLQGLVAGSESHIYSFLQDEGPSLAQEAELSAPGNTFCKLWLHEHLPLLVSVRLTFLLVGSQGGVTDLEWLPQATIAAAQEGRGCRLGCQPLAL